ncbi:hypothetical protein [Pseudomonas sp. GM78]|uniref:hypothetical protein n=1 Tax=Pseudomonas sp. GM78 TaxID=1144337 RepID=UPI0002F6A713|nr:hypothetical protein [Pseudomonas sp. GM78]
MERFLTFEPAPRGQKKDPVHCWRVFEFSVFSAHENVYDPPMAVVVFVVDLMRNGVMP